MPAPQPDHPYCGPFDKAVALHGPAAVFLRDRDDLWRIDELWTRDAWQRDPGPHESRLCWRLLRDHATGFVVLVMSGSPTLLTSHPRADVRVYEVEADALAARAAFGTPPVCREPW